MINFVICEDEKVLATEYKKEIDKFMMKYDFDYECISFDGYNEEWKTYAKNDNIFKIYLLDIKTNKGSGLDAARYIREELDDWTSMIIIITSFNEYKYDALGKRLMLVDFINKLDNYSEALHASLEICLKSYDNRPKVLKYAYKGIVYNIDFRHIVKIEKEQDTKRCTIYNIENEEIPYQGTINKIIEILDDRFIKISRSTIINLEHVSRFKAKDNIIEFRNGEKTNAISRDMRKGLIDHVRGLY